MDQFSVVRGIVTMVADYIRMPAEERQAKRDNMQDRALQIIKATLQSASPRAIALIEDFEKDPDTYEDAMGNYLIQQMSQDQAVADQLSNLLSQFHKERAAEQRTTILVDIASITSSGSVVSKGSAVVQGDVRQIKIGD